MHVWRIRALPNRNNVTSASWGNGLKLTGVYLAALLLNTLSASPLVAQSNDVVTVTSAQPSHAQRRASLDNRVKAFAVALNLNEPQQASVKRILELRQQETLSLRRDSSISGSVRIER